MRTLASSMLILLLAFELILPAWWLEVRLIAALGLLGVGVLHGSFDELLARKVLPQSRMRFYFSYLAASGGMLLSFYFSPQFTLLVFLLLSAYHFGEEELFKQYNPPVVALIRGASYFTPALLLHPQEVMPILSEMGVSVPQVFFEKALPLCLTLFAFDLLYASSRSTWRWKVECETWCFWAFAMVAHPLVSFALYFTMKHSREHVCALLEEWLKEQKGREIFQRSLPIIAATLGGSLGFICLSSALSAGVIAQIFVALAALSLPHAYLVHRATLRSSSIRPSSKVLTNKHGSRGRAPLTT